MLDRLIDLLPIPTDEHIDRKIRNNMLRELRAYCIKNNIGFYPELVTKLPSFAKAVEDYIEQKARTDLPKSQFTEVTGARTLEEWAEVLKYHTEIGGMLDLTNGGIKEINYTSTPGETSLIGNWMGVTFRTSTGSTQVSLTDLERANPLIDWHSHPSGFGVPSEGDIDHIQSILKLTSNEFYFIIYNPLEQRSFWYKMRALKKN